MYATAFYALAAKERANESINTIFIFSMCVYICMYDNNDGNPTTTMTATMVFYGSDGIPLPLGIESWECKVFVCISHRVMAYLRRSTVHRASWRKCVQSFLYLICNANDSLHFVTNRCLHRKYRISSYDVPYKPTRVTKSDPYSILLTIYT